MRQPHRGAHRRLARQLRDAHYRATDDEAVDLERLRVLVHSRALCVFEAQDILQGVLRGMHEREAA